MRCLVFALAALLGLAPLARAQGAADVAAFRSAAGAIGAGDWVAAEAAVAGSGAIARDLVRWMRLRDGPLPPGGTPDPRDPDPTFADYGAFVAARPGWPGQDRLRARGEWAIPDGTDPSAVTAWFGAAPPQTGEGAAALARALTALGRAGEARSVVETAWLTLGLTPRGQEALLAGFAETLAPLHVARAEAMLWRWRTEDAARMLPLLPADRRLLAEARIALIRGDGDRASRIAAVPAGLRDDPGLAVDRFNRLADAGDYSDAMAILKERSVSAAALGEPFRWASWRAVLARWAMREGRPAEAYAVATAHHLTEGDLYADLEWLAGYLALRQLGDPAGAVAHFTRMEAAVDGPISLSRAAYWIGRAEEARGDAAAAEAAFARAARHQTAFYGLLAAERLGLPLDPTLAGRESFGDWRQGPLLASDLTAAMLLLIAADLRGEATLFVSRQAQDLDRAMVGQLGAMLTDMGETHLALVAGKAAVERGIVIPSIYFPLHPLAETDLPEGVEPALALSIARRESEFNPTVGSPVGALGLMQLMPATAEEVAGTLGLDYSRARLTSDWRYNATLGNAYLAGLLAEFGPTPVMVAAGYNAGPGRPRQWNGQRGDPRRGEIDVVDWIEMIPFAETRNYVMRVTESIPVYRARLGGDTGPVAFRALLVGRPPVIRPVARPQRGAAVTVDGAIAEALAPAPPPPAALPPTGIAPLQSIRPLSRP